MPTRDYLLVVFLVLGFVVGYFFENDVLLYVVTVLAALPTLLASGYGLRKRKITIDVFNSFALIVAFIMTDARSAGFICLMLASARLLDYFTTNRTERSMRALLALKPTSAEVESDGVIKTIPAEQVKKGDIVVVSEGDRVPVDGVVIFGTTYVDESPLTGESVPVFKSVGEQILSGTIVTSGALKIRAVNVGDNSTVSQLLRLAEAAAANKSEPEKLADKFAGVFLPVVIIFGIVVFLVTKNLVMTASLFLVACADDMSVAVPLAVTAALGAAARRGVIVKGGERLAKIATSRVLILDKTGTLTFGNIAVNRVEIAAGVRDEDFFKTVGAAEKFSEHPDGRAVFRYAAKKIQNIPDPESYETVIGAGVAAVVKKRKILVGTYEFLKSQGIKNLPKNDAANFGVWVSFENEYTGRFGVSDLPRPEAGAALLRMKKLGFKKIVMFTGDREEVAASVARALGIDEYHSLMKPEDKVRELEKLLQAGLVIMVGDGINDAAALARADVGIAIGSGTAAAAEAADAVILVDDLGRLPELVVLARRSINVIKADVTIWSISNLIGFVLVLTGAIGIIGAAFYNFATDFLPILNSARMFKARKLNNL